MLNQLVKAGRVDTAAKDLTVLLKPAIAIPFQERDGGGLQLVDAVLQRLEPAVEMLGNGARVNVGQEFGAHEVGKAAGSVTRGDFFELAVFVFGDAEEDYATTGIGCHRDGTLWVHTG